MEKGSGTECSYLTARGHGIDWFEAIPFFTRRMFGHKFCFVKAGAGFEKLSNLRGRRFGIRTYENTLAFVVKGMFMHDYGLPLEDVTWVCVNLELVSAKLPPQIKVEHAAGRRLEELLAAGEIDAEVEPISRAAGFRETPRWRDYFPISKRRRRSATRRPRSFPSCIPS